VKGKVLQKKGFLSSIAMRRLTSSTVRKRPTLDYTVLNAHHVVRNVPKASHQMQWGISRGMEMSLEAVKILLKKEEIKKEKVRCRGCIITL